MSNLSDYINELKTAEAFSKQSFVFDEEYKGNTIIQYKRKRTREHLLKLLKPSSLILELNCGTGEDALFFAQHGHSVHATDVSEGMLARLNEKKDAAFFGGRITTELCSFNQLEALNNKGPFDAVFSNFGGLNCTGELDKVLSSLGPLLKPGGVITLVIIPPFCLWETLLLFKGRFKTATRRFFSSKGRKAHIEGVYFTCWYYRPGFVIKSLKKEFTLLKTEGLCTLVPPSYMDGFAEKHPLLYRYLVKKEEQLKEAWPWRNTGDYFIISLQKKT
jgi:ubiquinone/menaquinone biosynthesis C-methylase UbiE